MKSHGGSGRSARHYGPDWFVKGLLFSDPPWGYPRTKKRDQGQTFIQCADCGFYKEPVEGPFRCHCDTGEKRK